MLLPKQAPGLAGACVRHSTSPFLNAERKLNSAALSRAELKGRSCQSRGTCLHRGDRELQLLQGS